jgi:hypothetical protein
VVMRATLVFVHGRSQQHHDPLTLKRAWLDALGKGLAARGLTLPISESAVRFPYYGDTLDQLVAGPPGRPVAEVVVRGLTGDGSDPQEQEFVAAALDEVRRAAGVPDTEVRAAADGDPAVIDRGLRPAGWMHAVLKALDAHVPGAAGPVLALVTKDVYQYLSNPGVRDAIDSGVRRAFSTPGPTVVVAHSLGTVVAYSLLRREAGEAGWDIPLLVTLGCPLGVSTIRDALRPITRPPVGAWLNAADPRDVVALWPVESPRFPVSPAPENRMDVNNHTGNRHGIPGYLDDPVVAQRIHDALVATG